MCNCRIQIRHYRRIINKYSTRNHVNRRIYITFYDERWIIETNYNSLKNRFKLENYTPIHENIKQDVYSTIITFNIAFSIINYFKIKGKIKPENDEYGYKLILPI